MVLSLEAAIAFAFLQLLAITKGLTKVFPKGGIHIP